MGSRNHAGETLLGLFFWAGKQRYHMISEADTANDYQSFSDVGDDNRNMKYDIQGYCFL